MAPPASLEEPALLKILLHAAKYPNFAVNGLLLGKRGASGVKIADAVPVLHNYATLTPMLEAALFQVVEQARKSELDLVGYYQCNEDLSDSELGAVGKRIADRVDSLVGGGGGVALVLDAGALKESLEAFELSPADLEDGASGPARDDESKALATAPAPLVLAFSKEGGKWAKAALSSPSEAAAPRRLARLLASGRHRCLADFEDHLEDISLDWFNPHVLA